MYIYIYRVPNKLTEFYTGDIILTYETHLHNI